ncbi:MAG: ABC transporter permease [Candidatus Micrarchaeota archaeon]|nr:ABC transporter permease [Candidatus Micrarchaeota archaeon]
MKTLLSLAIVNLTRRKLRTFLTVLGVVIGVGAIIGLVGATKGISETVVSEIKKFQGDIIAVVPGEFKIQFSPMAGFEAKKSGRLTEDDVERIKRISGVDAVMGSITRKAVVQYRDKSYLLTVFGSDSDTFREIDTIGIWKGRYFKSGREAVLGYSAAEELFEIGIGKKILINGKEYKVVGILNKAGGFFRAFDTMVYVPKKTLRKDFGITDNMLSEIDVKVSKDRDPSEVAEEIESKLKRAHGKKDFTVISPDFALEVTSQVTGAMQLLLGGIAAISFIVGAIGIANMMFTSVVERTREIGILKALGATNRFILILFLLESGIIGLVGGVFGLVFGYGLGYGFLVVRQMMRSHISGAPELPMPEMVVTPDLIVFSLLLSFGVGILAGLFPARRAARLQPVEALRYE